jgi:hypothetical protein
MRVTWPLGQTSSTELRITAPVSRYSLPAGISVLVW